MTSASWKASVPGAGGDDHHAGVPAYAGIALGRVDRALFVPHENVADLVLIVAQAVIDGHDLPAGIAEDGIHPLLNEGQPQCFRSCNHIFAKFCYSITLTAPLSAELTIRE